MDPGRGYGAGTHKVLNRIASGEHWRVPASSAFGGAGSMGNGGAMRAAPIGGYFADDLERAAREAQASAEVTHAHPEGKAGATAIAVAAAWVASGGDQATQLFDAVLTLTPVGATHTAIARAAALSPASDVLLAVTMLGNGSRVTSQDTVPFVLWCVARHLGDFEEAMWTTVSGLGDRDTTCAMVGGILALHPRAEIPANWLEARETLEHMSLRRSP